MLIRTQNRMRLLDMTGITIRISNEYGEKYDIEAYANQTGRYQLLGTYSSKEKAIEVLDMIQNRYISSNVVLHGGFVKNTVFEMPEDSEVDV